MWFKLLFKYRYIIIIAVLIATNSWTYNKYLSKRDELTVCSERLVSRTAEVETANENIGFQNEAISRWKSKSIDLAEKIRGLSQDFDVISDKYNKVVYTIANEKVPKSCSGSMDWLIEKGKM